MRRHASSSIVRTVLPTAKIERLGSSDLLRVEAIRAHDVVETNGQESGPAAHQSAGRSHCAFQCYRVELQPELRRTRAPCVRSLSLANRSLGRLSSQSAVGTALGLTSLGRPSSSNPLGSGQRRRLAPSRMAIGTRVDARSSGGSTSRGALCGPQHVPDLSLVRNCILPSMGVSIVRPDRWWNGRWIVDFLSESPFLGRYRRTRRSRSGGGAGRAIPQFTVVDRASMVRLVPGRRVARHRGCHKIHLPDLSGRCARTLASIATCPLSSPGPTTNFGNTAQQAARSRSIDTTM